MKSINAQESAKRNESVINRIPCIKKQELAPLEASEWKLSSQLMRRKNHKAEENDCCRRFWPGLPREARTGVPPVSGKEMNAAAQGGCWKKQ